MSGRTPGGHPTAATRRKHGEKSGKHKGSFPIWDKKSARDALRLIGHAKSASRKASIRRRAARYGVHSASSKKRK